MTYKIRQLTSEDMSLYKNIRLEALKTNPEAFGAAYEEEILYKDDDFKKRLIYLSVFGVFFEEQIIGIIGFKQETLKKVRHNGELISFYVSPSFRDKGIGGNLIKYAIEYAKNHVSQLCLHCITENRVLVRFYEKHGFTTIGVYPKGMKLGKKFYDTNIMFRAL